MYTWTKYNDDTWNYRLHLLKEVYLHIDYEHVIIAIIENIISSKANFHVKWKYLGLLRILFSILKLLCNN